ncbi:MAG: 4-(cytidine 5'-diphospho)-2-C-methyl-D-erythritol kinase [Neomegalonema sp.]
MTARLARAKVNLCLHVVGQRPDGYHRLESLVVFPELGDLLHAEESRVLSLARDGPFGGELDAGADNLVLQAALALADHSPTPTGAALHLDKRLPVASGIGGGSADAAAALRLLSDLWRLDLPRAKLAEIALDLGADVPVCLESLPVMMEGVGDDLSPAPAMPEFWMVLVNPGVGVATPEVFRLLSERRNPSLPSRPERFDALDDLIEWLALTRNDLEPPAQMLRPVISGVLDAVRSRAGCRFARMSGSGATCFGLFERENTALDAASALRLSEPEWWVAAAPVLASRA